MSSVSAELVNQFVSDPQLGLAADYNDYFLYLKANYHPAIRDKYRQTKAITERADVYLRKLVAGVWDVELQKIPEVFVHQETLAILRGTLQLENEAAVSKRRFASGRQKIYAWFAERGQCSYCDLGLPGPLRSSPDHIVPFSQGGETVIHNLACACIKCNVAKGATPAIDFMDRLAQPDGQAWRDEQYKQQKAYFDDMKEERAYRFLATGR